MNQSLPKKHVFIPIWGKMAFVTILLLVGAALPTAILTSTRIKSDFGGKEEQSNRDEASTRINEINALLSSSIDRLGVIGTLRVQESNHNPSQSSSIVSRSTSSAEATTPSSLILGRDKDIIRFELYTRDPPTTAVKMLSRYVDDRYLKGYKLTASYVDDLDRTRPFPVDALFSGQPILRNRSVAKSAPIITIGVPVIKDNLGRVTHVAIADLPLTLLQRSFSKITTRTIYLVDKDGVVLAHPDERLVLSATNLANIPVVKTALGSSVSEGQVKYQDPRRKSQTLIAAYAKGLFGLSVISEVSESVILEPANQAQALVIRVALLAVFIGFGLVFWFSLTVTRPLKILVAFAGEVAKGHFNLLASKYVKSRDEVETLAIAFDGMTAGLRERDKVKNLMNKFHGSAVTQSLLEGDDVGLGGVRKKIAVFFSDIRGFTAFSENKTPEEVVSMLNEYFEEMVAIINRHHGVVDKFIGDAIMAIWGAPKSSGDDAYHAVMACLEMRQALDILNKKRVGRGDIPIKIGMGLHYGEAISGNIGSQARMEYTVIGDTVNMASRIESSTKAFGTDLLLSEDIANFIRDRFILEEAGSAEVKGKSEPLKFYKVRGYHDVDGSPIEIKTEWSDYEAEKADKVKVMH